MEFMSIYGGLYTSVAYQTILFAFVMDWLSIRRAFYWGFVFGQSHFMCMNCILASGFRYPEQLADAMEAEAQAADAAAAAASEAAATNGQLIVKGKGKGRSKIKMARRH